MQVSTSSISNLALNAIELRAAEMIARGEESSALFLLDDQLERDPSRASIAAMLARSTCSDIYTVTFERMYDYHLRGFKDAYTLSQFPGKVRYKKKSQERKTLHQAPPPYTPPSPAAEKEKKTK